MLVLGDGDDDGPVGGVEEVDCLPTEIVLQLELLLDFPSASVPAPAIFLTPLLSVIADFGRGRKIAQANPHSRRRRNGIDWIAARSLQCLRPIRVVSKESGKQLDVVQPFG